MKKIEIATELVDVINAKNRITDSHIYTGEEKAKMIAKTADRNSKETLLKSLLEEKTRHEELARREAYENKVKDFENSEEGSAAKLQLRNNLKTWLENLNQKVINDVEAMMGDKYRVYDFGSRSFEIVMVDENGKRIFGHTFNCYYGYDDENINGEWVDVWSFKANIGTMGEFKLDENDTQQEFYIGIGKFMSSPILEQLKRELKQYNDDCKEAKAAYRAKRDAYVAA